jgi:succinate-semialdehyde dehydrogenase/glutarate-semialdehyde dehydrogenase
MFMEPTVLVDVDHSMLLMQEETFGPLLPIMKVRDQEEAIRLANDCQYGLTAMVWSRDLERARQVASRLEAGTLLINDTLSHFAAPHLPFGGIKQSGTGRVHGKQDLLQFTRAHGYAVGRPPIALDVATQLRLPGRYRLGSALLHLLFGVTPRQRLEPVMEALGPVRQALEPVIEAVPEGVRARPAAGRLAGAGLLAAAAFLLLNLWRGRAHR